MVKALKAKNEEVHMSGMLDVSHQQDKPQDYKGKIFIGEVVANEDIAKLHRVKVMIPSLWEEYEPEFLPWCMPKCLPGGGGPTEYWQNVPETGSFVYVEFQNGDDMFPVYYGGVRDYRTMEGVLHENYPHRIGFDINSFMEVHSGDERHRVHDAKEPPVPYPRFRHHFFIDRMTNEVEYKHATETKFNIADNGRVFVEVRARDLPEGGDWIMHTDRHWVLEVSNAKFAGEPGHYYCNVLEDWWETHVETHILLKSRTETIDFQAPLTIRSESYEENIELEAALDILGHAGVDIRFSADNEVFIKADVKVTVEAPVIEATATQLIELTAPEITLNGHVTINGDIKHVGNNTQTGVHVDSTGVHA